MMRIAVDFQDESLEFELPEARVVGQWRGPVGLSRDDAAAAIEHTLENPRDYPPLRQVVVPGDRVAIAFDPLIPNGRAFLGTIIPLLESAGVEREGISLVLPPGGPTEAAAGALDGIRIFHHDPDDRNQLAYLAATKNGRRIYLSRHLTDADVVIPIAELGFDPILGHRGPWSVLFPRLSDQETLRAEHATLKSPDHDSAPQSGHPRLAESLEVSWLLGSQFHIGVVPGIGGLLEPIAGMETSVRDHGIASVARHWTFEAPGRAELVVAGVGRPGMSAHLHDLSEAIVTASRLVQRGGKIVVLSHAQGTIGPAMQRLTGVDDPRRGLAALKGHEADDDFVAASRLAHALSWADIFLYSNLAESAVEDLSMHPLDRPEHARKLVEKSGSCLFVSHADLTRAVENS
jgi:hypothetical protein